MEYTTYASRMKYLGAGDVDKAVVDYDGLPVHGLAAETLGHVDGFIVDAQAGRLYFIVVDSGGWFRSRRFLLPVGHASLEADRRALSVDVAKDALSHYPDFDADRFRQFSDEDLHLFEARMAEACCPGEPAGDTRDRLRTARRHYVQPAWWDGALTTRDRSPSIDGQSGPAAPSLSDAGKGEFVFGRETREALAVADDEPRQSER